MNNRIDLLRDAMSAYSMQRGKADQRHASLLAWAIAEIERLTQAMHANSCHPDYSYMTVPATFKPYSTGWERNQESDTAGSGNEVWRRKIS